MALTETLRSDITTALKAGDRERAGALRMVLSELQKAEKEGAADEVAVLRRERKRRLEAAEQFQNAGRAELAEKEETDPFFHPPNVLRMPAPIHRSFVGLPLLFANSPHEARNCLIDSMPSKPWRR